MSGQSNVYIHTHTVTKHTFEYGFMLIISLGTFDVQDIIATVGYGTITIIAKFIEESPAKGCLIIVTCNLPSPDKMMALTNANEEVVVTGLECNTYDILVYDVEENGLPNEQPAVQKKDIIVTQGQ